VLITSRWGSSLRMGLNVHTVSDISLMNQSNCTIHEPSQNGSSAVSPEAESVLIPHN
jgi:hypothetical protein